MPESASMQTYEDILESDVAVRDVEGMQIVDGGQQLTQNVAGTGLRVTKLVRGHDSIEQITALQTHQPQRPRP